MEAFHGEVDNPELRLARTLFEDMVDTVGHRLIEDTLVAAAAVIAQEDLEGVLVEDEDGTYTVIVREEECLFGVGGWDLQHLSMKDVAQVMYGEEAEASSVFDIVETHILGVPTVVVAEEFGDELNS
jgi:hypothetical protein